MTEVKPRFGAILIDETSFWDIPNEFKGKIEKLQSTYIVDLNAVTHACSSTPLIWLEPLSDEAVVTEDVSEDEVDDIFNWVNSHAPTDGSGYMDVSRIMMDIESKAIPFVEYGDKFDSEVYSDMLNEVREYYSGNAPF